MAIPTIEPLHIPLYLHQYPLVKKEAPRYLDVISESHEHNKVNWTFLYMHRRVSLVLQIWKTNVTKYSKAKNRSMRKGKKK